MPPFSMPLRCVAVSAAFALTYALATLLGRLTRTPDTSLALLWPAAAVAFVWVLAVLRTPRLAPSSAALLIVVSLAMGPVSDNTVVFSLAFLAVNSAHAVAAAVVYRAISGRAGPALLRLEDGAALLCGCAAGGLASGLLAAGFLRLAGDSVFLETLMQVGLRNATTTLLLGALVSRTEPPLAFPAESARRRWEWLALAATTAAACYVFGWQTDGVPIAFILLPLSTWAGLRFGTRVSTWHSAVIGAVVVAASWTQHGPFVAVPDLVHRVLVSQAFIAVVTIVGLGVALVEEDRTRALRRARESQRELAHQALHDPLTGLPNRTLLYDRVQQALGRRVSGGASTALLFFDVDRFKSVNDSLGHGGGDALLKALAERFRSAVRPSDTVARIGGDEFVVLCPDLPAPQDADRVAQRILAEASVPLAIDGQVLSPTVSGGIAMARPNVTAEELVQEADSAMFSAKGTGPGRVEYFSEALRDATSRRTRLEEELRAALAGEEFVVHYQPILDLRTNTVEGLEALVRWQHPARGLLLPKEWLDVAEDRALLPTLGAWVLGRACQDAAEFARSCGRQLALHVNVSPRQLQTAGFADYVRSAVESAGLAPSSVTLEITEREMLHLRRAVREELAGLRGLGVRLAADDFGTGYSSLAQLATMPVDVIKVDREFVRAMATNAAAHAVIQGIVAIGQALGLQVVAEGIEQPQQVELLAAEGIHLGQGFLWSRAVPPAAIMQLLGHDHATSGVTASSSWPIGWSRDRR